MSQRQYSPPEAVAIFGAGASVACGGFLMTELFQRGLEQAEKKSPIDGNKAPWLKPIKDFLSEMFSVDIAKPDYFRKLPDLQLVLSLVDLSMLQGQSFPIFSRENLNIKQTCPLQRMIKIRECLDAMICSALMPRYNFSNIEGKSEEEQKAFFSYEMFFDILTVKHKSYASVSLNYDMFADRALCRHKARKSNDSGLDYNFMAKCSVHFEEPAHWLIQNSSSLFKLHGSLDWVNCPGCEAIYMLFSEEFYKNHIKHTIDRMSENKELLLNYEHYRSLENFYENLVRSSLHMDQHEYDSIHSEVNCNACHSRLRPTIIAPTQLKNFASPHLRHVWTHAQRVLTDAEEIYFVGYSIPYEDLDFIALLKRSINTGKVKSINIISRDDKAVSRYKALFGDVVAPTDLNFSEWVEKNYNVVTEKLSYTVHDYFN